MSAGRNAKASSIVLPPRFSCEVTLKRRTSSPLNPSEAGLPRRRWKSGWNCLLTIDPMTLRLILIILIAVVALAGVAGYQMIRWAEAPVLSESDHPPQKIVVIPEGATFQQAAALLEREQLIRSRSAFLLLGKSQEVDRKIHPGEYEFNAAMAPAEILAKLLAGRVVLHSITIPEDIRSFKLPMCWTNIASRIAPNLSDWPLTSPSSRRWEFLRIRRKGISTPTPTDLPGRRLLKTS